MRGAGRWNVRIEDTAALTLSDLQLELVLGDRAFASYDRHARGSADVMVYRRSSSELLTAMNPADGSLAFGLPVSDPLPALPDPQAYVISGDVDGNGQVDLLARRGATIWIAFNKRGFSAWRPGSIAGGDLPSLADEVLMGDFDGDGFGDLLRRRPNPAIDRSVWACHRGVGDGTFEAGHRPDLEQLWDVNWAIADLGGLGHSDLILNQNSRGLISISYNISPAATTTGAPPLFYGAWWPLLGASAAGFDTSEPVFVLDANQDGMDDILVRRASGVWQAYLYGGGVSFTVARSVSVGGQLAPFRVGDMLLGSAPQVLR